MPVTDEVQKNQVTEDVKPCVVCAKPIPKAARKCTECNSYQHWLARFLGGINVSAFIALVPIVTLAWAFINERIKTYGSDLRATILDCQRDNVTVFSTNLGDRAAIIQSANYLISIGGKVSDRRPLDFANNDQMARVLDAGKSQILRLGPRGVSGAAVPLVAASVDRMDCTVRITLSTVAFDHEVTPVELVCRCPD